MAQETTINAFTGSMNMDVNPSFIKEGDYNQARNVRVGYSEDDNMGCVENIKGTLEIENKFLTSRSRWRTVGAATFETGSKVYQFRKDLVGTKDYIEEFDLVKRIFVKILSGNLNLPYKIVTAKYFNDMLIWNDGQNGLKQISVSLAKSGYQYLQSFTDTLIKFPPDRAITCVPHVSDPTKKGTVGPNQYQFIYRYVFVNNQKSVWSVASDVCVVPLDTYDYITLTLPSTHIELCDLYVGYIKYIEIGVRDDTILPYSFFKRIDFPSIRTAELTIDFANDTQYSTIATIETDLPYSDVPVRTNDFALVDNRIFTAGNTYGFEEVKFSVPLFEGANTSVVDNRPYMLQGGKYYVGVVFYDAYDRRSLVYPINVFQQPTRNGTFTPQELRIALGGEIPSWAKTWRIVVSDCSNVSDFIQVHVKVVTATSTELRFTNIFELPTPVEYARAFTTGDRISILTKNAAGDAFSGDKQNLPFDFDNTTGEYVVEGDFTGFTDGALVQMFSPSKTTETQFYYEVGLSYPVLVEDGKRVFGNDYGPYSKLVVLEWGDTIWSTTQDSQIRNVDIVKYDTWFRNNGRRNTVSQDVQEEVYNGSEIAFSDPLVQGTKLNGFNVFQPASKQTYGIEFGEIIKITTARDFQINGSVLLATTPFNNYSIYVGKNQIKTTAGVQILAVSDRLLGSANLLAGGFGSINPESIHAFGTTVRGWDALKGVYWRYSQDGLTAISMEYGANRYARYKADAIAPGRNEERQTAISCYDPFFDEWLICVRNASITENETLAFNETKNGFSTFYDFDPDWMVTLNSSVISWKNGVLYLHRANSEYNTLQGKRVKSNLTYTAKRNPYDTLNGVSVRVYAQDNWSVAVNGIKTTAKERQNCDMGLDFAQPEEDYYSYPVKSDQFNSPMKSRHFEVTVELDETVESLSVLYGTGINSAISPQSPSKT